MEDETNIATTGDIEVVKIEEAAIPAAVQWRLESENDNKWSLEFRSDLLVDEWTSYGTISRMTKNIFVWKVHNHALVKAGVRLNGKAKSLKAAYTAAIATKLLHIEP